MGKKQRERGRTSLRTGRAHHLLACVLSSPPCVFWSTESNDQSPAIIAGASPQQTDQQRTASNGRGRQPRSCLALQQSVGPHTPARGIFGPPLWRPVPLVRDVYVYPALSVEYDDGHARRRRNWAAGSPRLPSFPAGRGSSSAVRVIALHNSVGTPLGSPERAAEALWERPGAPGIELVLGLVAGVSFGVFNDSGPSACAECLPREADARTGTGALHRPNWTDGHRLTRVERLPIV